MKYLVAVVSIIIVIIVGVPISCQYMEEPYRYYDTYTKKLHSGYWVPNIFPKDIKDIHEQHDIDTNQVWLRFTLSEQKMGLANYIKVDKSNVTITKPFLASWWFDELPSHYQFYHGGCGDDGQSTLAISQSSKVVYWWC